jgi:hypothetical protein
LSSRLSIFIVGVGVMLWIGVGGVMLLTLLGVIK